MPRQYSKEDILNALKIVDIQPGDTVFVSTSLGMLGLLEGAKSNDELNQAFFESLVDLLGSDGTIIVPTYSYTFGKGRKSKPASFNTITTPSEIGPFPEYFRQQKNVIRTPDPFMSVSIWGKHAEDLVTNLPNTSYGHDCIFARLLTLNTKCLNIGLGPNWMAFIHHIEYLHNVPFRYNKRFCGFINGKESEWIYTVPVLGDFAVANAHKVARDSEQEGLWKVSELGRGRVYACSYNEYFDYVDNCLVKNQWCLASSGPHDIHAMEYNRINAEFSDSAGLLENSKASNRFIIELTKRFNMDYLKFDSGDIVAGQIIPEGWHCGDLSIYCVTTNTMKLKCVDYVSSYSLGFSGKVLGTELLQHVIETEQYFNDIKRDWVLKSLPFSIEPNGLYDINLNCGAFFSEMIVAYSQVDDSFPVDVLFTNGLEEKDIIKKLYGLQSKNNVLICSSWIALGLVSELFGSKCGPIYIWGINNEDFRSELTKKAKKLLKNYKYIFQAL
ncbi:AAC(3) family N-acetyltransferase [Pseudoalteromonas sp. SS15]|uniref:AAC(3) family N-acetyltransferase n=1 Tax=Pseudoalteromonas sp. SS15 TaxID=3139393 RepID=UPI003BA94F23